MGNRNERQSERRGPIARHRKGLSVFVAGAAALVTAELKSVGPSSLFREKGSQVTLVSGSDVRETDRRVGRVPQSKGGPLNAENCGENGSPVCYDERGSELGYYPEYCHDKAARPVKGICVVDFTPSGKTWEEPPFYNDYEHSPDK